MAVRLCRYLAAGIFSMVAPLNVSLAEVEPPKGQGDESLIRAAIFVQNNAGEKLDESVSMFIDVLGSRLADKGFSILDSHDVIARFQETKNNDDKFAGAVADAAKLVKFEKTESSVDQVLTGASALRIAQMLDANYLIVATLSSLGEERRRFTGEGTLYKTNNEVLIRTLRVSIRVLEGNQGGSVYGDTLAVSKKIGSVAQLEVVTDDMNNALIDEAAQQIADNISKKISKIRDAKVEPLSMAELTFTSNIEGATVEIDGAVLGTVPGSFAVRPGLHQIAVSKEWYSTWRRTINVVPNQVITVALERSKEGEVRHEEALRVARQDELTRKQADAAIAVAKEQSGADAYAKKAEAEGKKEYLQNSYSKIEGNIDNLTIEREPDAVFKIEEQAK